MTGKGFSLALFAVLAAVMALAAPGGAATKPTADLAITLADSPDPVIVGTPLTYTAQVQNLGPDEATGVTIVMSLPSNVDYVSTVASAGSCKRSGRRVTCTPGNVAAPNYPGPPTVTYTVIPRRIETVSATVTVSSKSTDPNKANNRATATTVVNGPPATCQGVTATIVGTPGDDTLVGTPGPDVIAALAGDDTVYALSGRDLVCAGAGADRVGAGPAADRVYGGAGRDTITGLGGPDLLKGGPANDVIRGNRGDDRLFGQAGRRDFCNGGPGRNTFRGCNIIIR